MTDEQLTALVVNLRVIEDQIRLQLSKPLIAGELAKVRRSLMLSLGRIANG